MKFLKNIPAFIDSEESNVPVEIEDRKSLVLHCQKEFNLPFAKANKLKLDGPFDPPNYVTAEEEIKRFEQQKYIVLIEGYGVLGYVDTLISRNVLKLKQK